MKRLFFVGILSILFVGASFAQFRIGVTAGLNASRMVGSGGGESEHTDFKAGFQAGVVADLGITENFSIMPELLFSQRGGKGKDVWEEEGINVDVTQSITLNYIQLPVNVAYKFNMGYGSKLFIFAGPYVGYGLSGKIKVKGEYGNVNASESTDIKFGSAKDDEYAYMKGLDFGLNAGVGYQYENIFFKLQYNHGLGNLNDDSNYSLKNQNVAFSVGYYFY